MSKRPEPDSDLKISTNSLEPDLKRAKTVDTPDTSTPAPTAVAEIDDPAIASSSALPGESSAPQKAPKGRQGRRGDKQDFGKKTDRRGKRATREREPWNAPRESTGAADGEEKKERLAKRKCAVLIGFCGTGYSGMQVQTSQKDTKTIEGSLFDAFVKAGAVSADNSDDPSKVSLARAARTDAGVHAAGNVVSLKMINSIPELEEAGTPLISHINSFLPPQIRVWEILRTTNNFNARTSCDSRIYEYLFPSYILMPPDPSTPLGARLYGSHAPKPSAASTSSPEKLTDSLRQQYRAPAEQIERVQELLSAFEGTHNFHNYTVARDFRDRAAQRYMIKLEVRPPQVYDGLEWISVQFHGQSFMLHQRKMIGLVMLAARTSTPPSLIAETYGPSKIHIPKAPALGLLLEQPQFGVYNLRVEESNTALRKHETANAAEGHPIEEETTAPSTNVKEIIKDTNDGGATIKEKIDFEPHRDLIEEFKREHIYAAMRTEESEQHTFARWIASVDGYAGSDFDYLNNKGIIPPSAVLKKGEKKADAFAEPAEDDDDSSAPGGKRKMEELEG